MNSIGPRGRLLALLLLLVLSVAFAAPGAVQAAVPRPRQLRPAASSEAVPPHLLYLPSNAAAHQPLPVLLVIHGMGGDGPSFAQPLLSEAERRGWIVVAPTLAFGDWRDPEQVRRDDTTFIPQLKALLESLPSRTGLRVQPRALLYGFSRGCQEVHRFASFYPRLVRGVASFSCGTYTLPYTQPEPGASNLPLQFPFGLADIERYTGRPLDLEGLQRVNFLIGVGGRDNQASDLPRQWDAYLGDDRVERAYAYYQALRSRGIPAELTVFPTSGHVETPEMRQRAVEFLAGLS